ncbi:phosphotransferase [Labrys wisconsinensis]|uniref:Hydroxylysine kinase n=1 Tax=Labrys wisconsinensis TaxID=425677 RepID=A0ABU0JIG7_9HYPH|nr:phosphotransferase [Labrys wisconsinensis]MDQ0474057.1 Ser/Thr protein kinase RdoA (MazF antagonist) [Labrys wisconsinensis]
MSSATSAQSGAAEHDTSPLGDALALPARPVAPDVAAAILREHYGRDASASVLRGEKDGNFHVRDGQGRDYLLKIVTPHEAVTVSDFQTALLLHLEAAAPSIPVQRIVRTRDGRPDLTLPFDGEGVRRVRLVTFLPGRLMRDVAGPQHARQAGAALAGLQLALAPFRHPGADHALLWDLRQAAGLRPLLAAIDDPDRRRALEGRLDIFEAELAPALARLPRQVVHNDFSSDNLLVDPADTDRIVGILDFGDAVSTAAIADVAAAAAYQLDADADDPVATLARFVGGFGSVRPLQPEEVEILYDLVVTRLVVRLAITQWRARRMPDNQAYILRNTPKVWHLFERACAVPGRTAAAALRAACG